MSHIHWVARQNKLEIPKDKDEVNKQDIHECDGRAHDPDTMVTPLTPKPKRKLKILSIIQMGKTYQRQHSAREICTPLMFVAYVK
jgi:hypothetical protein